MTCCLLAATLMSAAGAHPAAAQDSWKAAKVAAAGVSFDYPDNWIVFPLTKDGLAAQQRGVRKRNPALALSGKRQARLIKTTKYFVADLGAALAGGFESSASVQDSILGGLPRSLQQFTSVVNPGLLTTGATILSNSAVHLSGARAYRVDLRLPVKTPDGVTVQARIGQLYVNHGSGSVTLTVTAPDDDSGAMLIDRVLNSARHL